jgi:hypothetical protein
MSPVGWPGVDWRTVGRLGTHSMAEASPKPQLLGPRGFSEASRDAVEVSGVAGNTRMPVSIGKEVLT